MSIILNGLKCEQGPPGPGGLPGELGKAGPPVSRGREKGPLSFFFYWDSEEDTRGYKYLSWLQTDNIKEEETTVTAISLFTRNSHSR